MAYVEIKDFKSGLDTRRPAVVGEPGTLVRCTNAVITRGGDVESGKKFVLDKVLPEGTFGWHPAGNNKFYIFGHGVFAENLPGHIIYQQLENPDDSNAEMIALLAAENFDGKVYAIAEYDDGSVFHFYDGQHVTDWDTKAASIADDESVAAYLTDKIDAQTDFIASSNNAVMIITAAVPGEEFTIDETTSGTGTITITQIQPNVEAVEEVRAEGSFEVTGGFPESNNKVTAITADGEALIASPVAFILDNEATALACASKINQSTSTHGYTATSSGAVVTIKAPVGEGADANGVDLEVTVSGFVTVDNVTDFADGVTEVEAEPQIEQVEIGGTYDDANVYTITLNDVDYTITGLSSGMGRIAKTFKEKMHSAVRALLIFSAIDDPTTVTSGTGFGLINISNQDQGSQRLTALGIYQNLFAVFTRDTVQIWDIDPDPNNNSFRQLLQNTGTRSPKSVIGFGNSDLFYLSDTGIRSLRARDSANNAAVDDIGTRIDTEVIEYLETLSDAQIEQACGVVDPRDGRAWIAVGERIFIFSYFPGGKISAWSWFEPGFAVDGMGVANRRIYVRSGDNTYVYGGVDGQTYPDEDETDVTVQLPFIDANRISGNKHITGVDIICGGDWTVQLLLDPRDESKGTTPIVVSGPTTLLERIPIGAETTHFAPKLTSSKGGRLTLSSVVVHFEDKETT